MQYLVTMFISSVFDWKYPFWAILVQKLKTVCSKWNLTGRLIRVCRIQWFILSVHFEQIKWTIEFCILESSSALDQKYSFWENPLLLLLSWSMVLILFEYEEFNRDAYFFCFRQEVSFLGNFFEKVKIICLTWNLESREIGMCRIWWWFSFFFFFFIFRPDFQFLSQKNYLAFWWYLINLPAVFSQRLQTSTFSYCF